MLKYTAQRVLLMLLTLLIITGICFVLVRMLPPVELPPNDPHTQIIQARREAQGYNKPYLVQFGIFLRNVLTKWDWASATSCISVRMSPISSRQSFPRP